MFSSGLVARELQKTRVEKNKIIRFVDIINWHRSEVAVGIRTERWQMVITLDVSVSCLIEEIIGVRKDVRTKTNDEFYCL